jgi:YesN/AraC family two-component response regulator
MKKLLIVEDEKMIRQGIQAMVMRAPVHIDEVILCKNGEEAYEILKNQKIDVMITDIRMPKMDGITLVREIQSLKDVPKIVVASGYDDFSYAVELMRYGAKDYILKPVEREKINQILIKLESEIVSEQEQQSDIQKLSNQQYKYMLLNSNIAETEIAAIENKFKDYFVHDHYVVCCTNTIYMREMNVLDVIFLDDINGQSVFIAKAGTKEELLSDLLKDHYVGVSRKHKTLRELREAYQEALHARKNAFATGNFITEYHKEEGEKETISEEMIEQFVQMVGTDKLSAANKFLTHILYKTKQGLIEPDHFCNTMNHIVDKICINYKNLLDIEGENRNDLKNVYDYDNADSYYDAISDWILNINEKLGTEFNDYKNKQKIQKAIHFIQENYNKDLNMAVVSNHISMNYSLFSYVFKQYIGMNFVNYLKTIRINEAKRLLEETDKKVIEISNLIGYENEKNFMKIFRSVCGVSPSEYRKNVQVGKLSE